MLRKASPNANEALRCCLRGIGSADVRESYKWGCRTWGKDEAPQWVRRLRAAVSQQLAIVPKGFPLAPEDDEFFPEIRQMIVGRYRVLFTIKRRTVHVLHVRGSYIGEIDPPEDGY